MSESIVDRPWEFARKWYGVDEIHASIRRRTYLHFSSDSEAIPKDVHSRDFAKWLAHQYRLAMCKGAELAIREMQDRTSGEAAKVDAE